VSYAAQFPENQLQAPASFDQYVLRARFCALFAHGWDFLVKEIPEAPWKTIKKYKLTESKFWYKYHDLEQILGVRFGTTTRYGMMDLDWRSAYHPRENEAALRALKGELESFGISRFILIQSSDSGGLHLYFVFDRPVNSFRLACLLAMAAANAGLTLKQGQLVQPGESNPSVIPHL
jgi:hypothetical protein